MDFKLWLNEGLGNVRIPITEKDMSFVHMIRIICAKRGITPPPTHRVLHLRYALLHSLPFHQYEYKNEDGQTKIYDKIAKGSMNHLQYQYAAVVNDEMKKQYYQATNKTPTSDQEVAQWWMDENKNALQEPVTNKNPSAQVKVLSISPKSISVAFRSKSNRYSFNVIEDIPYRVDNFRRSMEEKGYEQARHGGTIINTRTFEKLIEPDKIGKGGKTPNPRLNKMDQKTGLYRPKPMGLAHFVPGHQEAGVIPSEEYYQKYKNDPEFRRTVEMNIINSIQRELTGVRIGFSPQLNHEIKLSNTSLKYGTTEPSIRDLISKIRTRIKQLSGEQPTQTWFEDPNWVRWFFSKVTTVIRSSKGKIFPAEINPMITNFTDKYKPNDRNSFGHFMQRKDNEL